MVGEDTEGTPPNPHGALGTPKSSGRHIRHKFQRGSERNPCHKSQPLETEEPPNLEVSPKPRENQIMEEAGISVFGGRVPQSQRNWKSTRGPPHLSGPRWGS